MILRPPVRCGGFTEDGADGRYGRAITRAVLGHSSRRTPTDHYVHVPIEQVADVLGDYEAHLLSWDRASVVPIESAAEHRRAG